jgi:hypothetical protein
MINNFETKIDSSLCGMKWKNAREILRFVKITKNEREIVVWRLKPRQIAE